VHRGALLRRRKVIQARLSWIPLGLLANSRRLVTAHAASAHRRRLCGRTFLQILVRKVSSIRLLHCRLHPRDHIREGRHSCGLKLICLGHHLGGGVQMLRNLGVLAQVDRISFLQLLSGGLRRLHVVLGWHSSARGAGSILLGLFLFRSILLVQHVLVFTHFLGLVDAELLSLLVPAPLVDLGLGKVRRSCDLLESLLGPKVILLKCICQLFQLALRLAFALADHTDHLPVGFIKHVAAAARDRRDQALSGPCRRGLLNLGVIGRLPVDLVDLNIFDHGTEIFRSLQRHFALVRSTQWRLIALVMI